MLVKQKEEGVTALFFLFKTKLNLLCVQLDDIQ